jgi:hypothetical protein
MKLKRKTEFHKTDHVTGAIPCETTGSPSYVLVVSIGRFIREDVWGI